VNCNPNCNPNMRRPACTLQGMACVRSGQAPAWPLCLLAGGGAEAPTSRVGPEDHFCEAVRNDLRVPLTVEGHPRTLSGPSPDLRLTVDGTSGGSPASRLRARR
jgi:hypothetical protein